MKHAVFFALVATAISIGCSDPHPTAPATPVIVDGRIPVYAPAGSGPKYVAPTGKGLDVFTDPAPPARTRNRVEYHPGGPVLTGNQLVVFIWYGSWPSSDPVRNTYQQILINFASKLCTRPYTDIVRAYPAPDGRAPTGCLGYGGSVFDSFSHGPTLSDADVADIVLTQVAQGQIGYSENIIPIVVASPEIAETSGFGTSYCGWHGRTDFYGILVHFGFIGWPERAPTNCAPNGVGPNGTVSADAAVSELVALWANIITDPNYDAWFDKLGLEVADKCVWSYGTTYTAANGQRANVKLDSNDYLLQQLWVPSKSGGACGLHP